MFCLRRITNSARKLAPSKPFARFADGHLPHSPPVRLATARQAKRSSQAWPMPQGANHCPPSLAGCSSKDGPLWAQPASLPCERYKIVEPKQTQPPPAGATTTPGWLTQCLERFYPRCPKGHRELLLGTPPTTFIPSRHPNLSSLTHPPLCAKLPDSEGTCRPCPSLCASARHRGTCPHTCPAGIECNRRIP